MPDIDMSDVILDAAVAGEPFQFIRRVETVNNYGESTVMDTITQAYGSIGPVGDNSLIREEAFDAQSKTIAVITNAPLQGAGASIPVGAAPTVNTKADIILWNSNFYIVRSLEDFSSYGAGFVRAECSMIDYEPTPTGQNSAFNPMPFVPTRN